MSVSEVAVSGVLVREENKKQKLIFYTSKMLLDAETRYSDLEKMVLALDTTKKKLRHYFESHPVTVVTNSPQARPLREINKVGNRIGNL